MAKKNKFQLIGEDDSCFHVHDGEKNFIVAKKLLPSRAMQEKIRSYPKYAAGGVVEPNEEEFSVSPVGEESVAVENTIPQDPNFIVTPVTAVREPAANVTVIPQPVATEPVVQVSPAVPTATAPSVSKPVVAEAPMVGSGLQQQIGAIKNIANIEQKKSDEEAALRSQMYSKEEETNLKEMLATARRESEEARAELDKARNMGLDQKEDPNRLWKNMSTGNRILAGISMILGGAASGGNAANNAAANAFDAAINRDIEAQKQDKRDKESLYNKNLARYKDAQSAEIATRMQMRAFTEGKIAAMGAQYGGPLAKARAEQVIGALKQQNEKEQEQLDFQRYKLAAENAGKANDLYLPGYGRAQVKPTDKDREQLYNAKQIKQGLTELQRDAVKNGPALPGTERDKVNKTKVAALKLQMKNAYQLGVLSQSDLDMLDELVSDPGSFWTSKSVSQLEATKKSMDAVENSVLTKLGVQTQNENTVRVSNGKETFDIPAANLAAAQKDGFRQVR